MMDPQDFLTSAKDCFNSGNSRQVDYRNSISRAYYCLYHRCKSLATSRGLVSSYNSSHDAVVNALKNDSELRKFGGRLIMLKRRRHQADYRLDSPLTKRDVIDHLNMAEKTLRELPSD